MQNKASRVTLGSYFRREKRLIALTAVTGIVYNVGMTAGPWFEGQLAQYLYDVLGGSRQARDLVVLSLAYVAVIALVQAARALKRLYVRKFANNVSRSMKESIYHHLVHEPTAQIEHEDAGSLMTRAIADAEDCAEGMRKFTTEIFDTGVVMVAYLVMLLVLDWRLTLVVLAFPPIAYVAAAALKRRVTGSVAKSRHALSHLNDAAVDAVDHALTYRVYGEDGRRAAAYEGVLGDYERANVAAGIWQNSPQPVYLAISMIGVIPILYLGGANVLGHGWIAWSIASFSSFLSCFAKLATKSSHAANLFNAVQKAQVSWHRIEGYLDEPQDEDEACPVARPATLTMERVSFAYDATSARNGVSSAGASATAGSGTPSASGFALHDLNLTVRPGEIVGVTGKVASGKSTFGRLFLAERPYGGSIRFGGRDIRNASERIFAYLGHDPELFTGTVRDNVALAERDQVDERRLAGVLDEVCIDGEVTPDSQVGMEGTGLSGGQQARVGLARALYSKAPVLVLDDPFSAVDATTEQQIFRNLRERESWRAIVIISHRLATFPQMDQVAYLEDGTMRRGTHAELMGSEEYRALYELQTSATKLRENATPQGMDALRPTQLETHPNEGGSHAHE